MPQNFRTILPFFILLVSSVVSFSQKNKLTTVSDTLKPKSGNVALPKPAMKPYEEVITNKAISSFGLFTVHNMEDRWFFEISKKLLGKDILTVSRISKGAVGVRAGLNGYAGDEINENVVRFEKGPNNKLFLKNISYQETSRDSLGGMYWNVINSNMQPIISSFDIKAISPDSSALVIDVSDLLNGDNEILFFDNGIKRMLGITGVQSDKSYICSVKSFTENVEIKTVKTYGRMSGGSQSPSSGAAASNNSQTATFELNSSIVLLPEKPMQPRYFDERVGYFTTQSITDFDLNPQGIERVRFVRRFRMEPRPEDLEKYKNGELVVPIKPIIFYIDPTTPKKWIPYLIQGVNDWQAAFETAGFKDAIVAKLAPTHMEDSTWSIDDARHNAIIYKPSEIANASGPSIIDPRSGEVLEAHINWFHNVMSLLRNWYFVQASAIDPRAHQLKYDDELMGELIRTSLSHEVGHTLGLLHNLGASSSVPVEKLRDKNFVEINGHTPSIMDYARYNYVAQPEDSVSVKSLLPKIGDYDKWAIEWGYKWLTEYKSAGEETDFLNKLTIKRLQNKRLYWGDGETNRDDPRNQMEDVGDNAMLSGSYGVKNLKRIINNLVGWTTEPNKDYGSLRELYNQVITQFSRYSSHVATNIGGIERTPKRVEQPGPVYNFTSQLKQEEALKWLEQNIFKTPTWIVDKNIIKLTGANSQNIVGGLQDRILSALISANTIARLLRFENDEGTKAFTVTDMLSTLRKSIFRELATRKPIDMYRRTLQKSLTEKITGLLESGSGGFVITIGGTSGSSNYVQGVSKTSDAISIAKAQLRLLQAEIKRALPGYTHLSSKNHLLDLSGRIELVLNPK